jgi:hypothetical protein
MPVPRFLSLSICALAVASAPLAALAAPDRDAGRAVSPSSNEARFVLRGYADCLARNDPRGVDSFLELSPFDPNFGRRGAAVSASGCLVGGRLKFTAILLRGALFAVKYKRDFGAMPPPVMIGAMDLAPAGTSPTAADGGAAIRFVVTAADCMAMRDLSGARALVLAPIGSKAERESLARLAPAATACAPGLDLARAKEPIESALAEVLYRRAVQGKAMIGNAK